MYGTTMNNGIMTYRNITADIGWVFLVCTMNYSSILYIYFIAHFYIMHIPTHNGIKPNAAILSHYYIAYNSSIRSHKTIIAKLRMLIKKRKYSSHNQAVCLNNNFLSQVNT